MADSINNTEITLFNNGNTGDTPVSATLPDEQVELIEEIADNRGIPRTALLRQWIYAGWKFDDKFKFSIDTDESTESVKSDPYEELFVEHLPEDPENAVSIDELKELITTDVENHVMQLFREYDDIEMNDGKVFQNK
jgi:hypothetical protein